MYKVLQVINASVNRTGFYGSDYLGFKMTKITITCF